MSKIIVDTDVLIDFLRGYPPAVNFLKSAFPDVCISAITAAELYAGVREGEEREKLVRMIRASEKIEVTFELAIKAGLLKRDFQKSHGIGLADAILAATSEEHGLLLVTLNKKHYPMLKHVNVPYQKKN